MLHVVDVSAVAYSSLKLPPPSDGDWLGGGGGGGGVVPSPWGERVRSESQPLKFVTNTNNSAARATDFNIGSTRFVVISQMAGHEDDEEEAAADYEVNRRCTAKSQPAVGHLTG